MGRSLLFLFRWGIFLLACVFLYTKLWGPKGIAAVTDQLLELDPPRWSLVLVGLLVFVNWGVEAVKWRHLVRTIQSISYLRAFIATIAGTSVGLVTVNRTGEFLGRVLFLAPEDRVKGSFATAIGSIAQFVVTLMAGGSGLFTMVVMGEGLPWSDDWVSWVLITLSALVTVMSLVLYLLPGFLRQLLLLIPPLRRFERSSVVLAQYQRSELLQVLGLSLIRYIVFTFQYALVLSVCDPGIPVEGMVMAIPLVYLIATLVPSIMLTELGVRGSVAVAVLSPLGGSPAGVLISTTILWTINVAIPALAGSLILVMANVRTGRITM